MQFKIKELNPVYESDALMNMMDYQLLGIQNPDLNIIY